MQDERLHRRVVLKILREERARRRAAVERFLEEARAAARFAHPNVIQLFDYGDAGGAPFIVEEYAPGGSVADLLRRQGALEPARALAIMSGVLAGLAHVHDHGLVHGDVKPANVLLGEGDVPKLADFGVARAEAAAIDPAETVDGLVEPASFVGTLAYASPEAVAGRPLTRSHDVYSAGAVLYEMMTGQLYLDLAGLAPAAARRAVLDSPPRPPPQSVDGRIRHAWSRALAKDPAERFGSALEFAAALAVRRGATTA